jgi:hypothetical protein
MQAMSRETAGENAWLSPSYNPSSLTGYRWPAMCLYTAYAFATHISSRAVLYQPLFSHPKLSHIVHIYMYSTRFVDSISFPSDHHHLYIDLRDLLFPDTHHIHQLLPQTEWILGEGSFISIDGRTFPTMQVSTRLYSAHQQSRTHQTRSTSCGLIILVFLKNFHPKYNIGATPIMR